MKKSLLKIVLLSLISTAIFGQSADPDEVLVSNTRASTFSGKAPGTSIRRVADFALLKVEVSNDAREEKVRTEEIHETLKSMQHATVKDKSIELVIVADNGLV